MKNLKSFLRDLWAFYIERKYRDLSKIQIDSLIEFAVDVEERCLGLHTWLIGKIVMYNIIKLRKITNSID